MNLSMCTLKGNIKSECYNLQNVLLSVFGSFKLWFFPNFPETIGCIPSFEMTWTYDPFSDETGQNEYSLNLFNSKEEHSFCC